MGSLSVSSHRGLAHCKELLLVVSLLTFCCLPTNAQFSIVSTTVAEGEEVRLNLHENPYGAVGYRWFRGEGERFSNLIAGSFSMIRNIEKGRFYDNQKIADVDGTLLIKKASLKDTGTYTVVAYLPDEVKEIGFGRLDVYRPVVRRPFLQASNITVSVNSNVVMSCLSHALSTEWLFNGMALQLSKRKRLSKDRSILTIDPVHMEDAGYYQCKVYDPVNSAESWPLVLYVHHE